MRFKAIEKTKIKVNFLKIFYVSFFSGFRIRKNLMLGKLGIVKTYKAFYQLYQTKKSLMFSGPLSDELVNEWKTDNIGRVTPVIDRKIKKTIINDEILSDKKKQITKHQKLAPFLIDFINNNKKNINSIAHIGARVDTLNAYFCKLYPNIDFHSIDLQPNMEEINEPLGKEKNWKLHNGYALEEFERNNIKADMVIMISTSPKFNHLEFHRYMKAFKNNGIKFIIFYEPWWAFPLSIKNFWIKRPENISRKISPLAGMTADFTHNYIDKLIEFDYIPVMSEIRDSKGQKNFHELFILAADAKLNHK